MVTHSVNVLDTSVVYLKMIKVNTFLCFTTHTHTHTHTQRQEEFEEVKGFKCCRSTPRPVLNWN
jgi:hypothetical protein